MRAWTRTSRCMHVSHTVIRPAQLHHRCQRLQPCLAVPPNAKPDKAHCVNGHGPAPASSDLRDYHHPVDPEEFRKLGYQVVDWIADYYKSLNSLTTVKPKVKPGFLRPLLPEAAPEQPQPFHSVMDDFNQLLMPGVLHWQSPKFFAYFNANSSFPGILADMLMAALNMIGFTWAASPVSTELEMVMMDWLAQLLGLPDRFKFSSGGMGGGVIQGTTSEAVLVALLAAKSRAMQGRPPEDALKLVVYTSDQAHSCVRKACMIAGIQHLRVIPAGPQHDYALQASDLAAAMAADVQVGLIPMYLCATIGTTSSCAVDPIPELAQAAAQHGVWIHVDAAYAGAMAICPDMRAAHFSGLELVDSYSMNPHKSLCVNFDCCAMWVADSKHLRTALELTPVFLAGLGNALDYKDWGIPLGRRFRSLKLYFVLRMYGAEPLRRYVRHHCALAAHFARRVEEDARFEVAAPQRFGLVCFRLRGAPREAQVALLEAVNARGDMFLTHTELSGQYTLRLAVGSPNTQLRHVEEAWEAVCTAADQVLASSRSNTATQPLEVASQ